MKMSFAPYPWQGPCYLLRAKFSHHVPWVQDECTNEPSKRPNPRTFPHEDACLAIEHCSRIVTPVAKLPRTRTRFEPYRQGHRCISSHPRLIPVLEVSKHSALQGQALCTHAASGYSIPN